MTVSLVTFFFFLFSFLPDWNKTKQTFCCLFFFFFFKSSSGKKDFNSSFLKHLCQSFSWLFSFFLCFCCIFLYSLALDLREWSHSLSQLKCSHNVWHVQCDAYKLTTVQTWNNKNFYSGHLLNIFHGIINYSLWEYPSLAWT